MHALVARSCDDCAETETETVTAWGKRRGGRLKRWDLRQHADVVEKLMKNNYKNIEKAFNPWSRSDMDS